MPVHCLNELGVVLPSGCAPQNFGNIRQKATRQEARLKVCGRTADIQTQPSWGSLFHPLQPTLDVLFFAFPSRLDATCHKTKASRPEKRAGRFRLAYPSETAQPCIWQQAPIIPSANSPPRSATSNLTSKEARAGPKFKFGRPWGSLLQGSLVSSCPCLHSIFIVSISLEMIKAVCKSMLVAIIGRRSRRRHQKHLPIWTNMDFPRSQRWIHLITYRQADTQDEPTAPGVLQTVPIATVAGPLFRTKAWGNQTNDLERFHFYIIHIYA